MKTSTQGPCPHKQAPQTRRHPWTQPESGPAAPHPLAAVAKTNSLLDACSQPVQALICPSYYPIVHAHPSRGEGRPPANR